MRVFAEPLYALARTRRRGGSTVGIGAGRRTRTPSCLAPCTSSTVCGLRWRCLVSFRIRCRPRCSPFAVLPCVLVRPLQFAVAEDEKLGAAKCTVSLLSPLLIIWSGQILPPNRATSHRRKALRVSSVCSASTSSAAVPTDRRSWQEGMAGEYPCKNVDLLSFLSLRVRPSIQSARPTQAV
jgi:hypothetical protein